MSKNGISKEEKALFRQEMRFVKPLQNASKKHVAPKVHPETPKPRCHEQETTILNPVYLSSQYSVPVYADTILSHREAGLPLKRFQQLKKGLIPWQSRLDLHGLSVDHAANALRLFISHQNLEGNRSLLIIHGKGGHRGEVPMIKSYVNHWLAQFPEVLAFHSALPRDGGAGAVYVLLKRHRI
ncbi:Smr/MutS family protein [Legionella impletisoli]|uniref:DNA mismatch repair protein MutS n=1 Tax=Legionella impletisoli TaxID=343510 RepID=A0A917JT65_9GAMM|nr:Smr/MutS family protein [Legionella impletisoli]GGI85750.1 DNA mismatch repair protein MutS [Legionella impletisoli]